jgi:hypothetical protein
MHDSASGAAITRQLEDLSYLRVSDLRIVNCITLKACNKKLINHYIVLIDPSRRTQRAHLTVNGPAAHPAISQLHPETRPVETARCASQITGFDTTARESAKVQSQNATSKTA